MRGSIRIIILLDEIAASSGHGWHFSNELLAALDACDFVERVYALPRIASPASNETAEESIVYDRQGANGPMALAWRLIVYAWRGIRVDLVICKHIRVLPFAWLYARLSNSRLALVVHDPVAAAPTRSKLANRLAKSVDSFIATSADAARKFGRWSGVCMDRGFLLPDEQLVRTGDRLAIEQFRAAIGDWLWGCVSVTRAKG